MLEKGKGEQISGCKDQFLDDDEMKQGKKTDCVITLCLSIQVFLYGAGNGARASNMPCQHFYP